TEGCVLVKLIRKLVVWLENLVVSTVQRVILPYMNRGYVWHKTLAIGICLLTATVTLDLEMVTRQQGCVIPKQECPKFQWSYKKILIKIPLIISITMMARNVSRMF